MTASLEKPNSWLRARNWPRSTEERTRFPKGSFYKIVADRTRFLNKTHLNQGADKKSGVVLFSLNLADQLKPLSQKPF